MPFFLERVTALALLLPTKNLVLVVDKSRCDPADFLDIADRIRAQAADVRVQVLSPKTIHSIARETWENPTLMVCLIGIPGLAIRRGKIMITRPIPKVQQAEMMKLGGIPTPHVERYRFGMTLEESLWGSHVILKPEDLRFTSKGVGLEVVETKTLSGMREPDFAPDHFVHGNKLLVQRFIDTGTQPQLYRALTFMGEALYIYKSTWAPEKPVGTSQVPAHFHSKNNLEISQEFLPSAHVRAFAGKLAAAFRDWPLLGCDILEEHGSGKLYALEVNAGGNVWHFSSPYNAAKREKMPEVNALRHSQYGAFDIAAKALISATRRLAV